MGIKMRAQQAK